LTAGQLIEKLALERENDVIWHATEVTPLTNEARTEERVQNFGTLCKVACDEDPKDENSAGKTLLTIIGAGTVYERVPEMLKGELP